MNSIDALSNISLQTVKPKNDSSASGVASDFGDMLKSMIDKVNDAQIASNHATKNLQAGNANHLHEVMVAVEEADVSLRMLVQMRNKALTAYDEIMRMQI